MRIVEQHSSEDGYDDDRETDDLIHSLLFLQPHQPLWRLIIHPVDFLSPSAALFAACHDGGVEALAEAGGQIVNLVGAIDLNGLARGAERYFAVLAAAQMLLQVSAHLGSYRVVDQVVEQGEELSARHFSPTFFLRK
jgi:hypothetical protein